MEMDSQRYFKLVADVAAALDAAGVERLSPQALADLGAREERLVLLGVGRNAGNCSHATISGSWE